jgi:hypothetical protein
MNMKRFMPSLAAIAVLAAPLATTATAIAGQDASATPDVPIAAATVEPFALVGGDYGSQGFHHGLPETSLVPKTEPVAGEELPD